jgi:hypothetical protein
MPECEKGIPGSGIFLAYFLTIRFPFSGYVTKADQGHDGTLIPICICQSGTPDTQDWILLWKTTKFARRYKV